MSWRGCAFATFVPLSAFSGRRVAIETKFAPNHGRKVRCNRNIGVRTRVRAAFGPPEVPDDIKQLDELERNRRVDIASHPPPSLSDATKAILFEKYPEVRAADENLRALMEKEDYDPEDHRTYSWAYEKLRPWAPSPLLQVVAALGMWESSRLLWRTVRARVSIPVLMSTLVRFEATCNVVLLVVVPLLLCGWAVAKSHMDYRTDGVRRTALMHTLSSTLLLPVAAVASVGYGAPAAAVGALVRLLPMSMSLWYWRDLRREVFLGTTLLARMFRIWRFFTTWLIIFGGCCFRVVGIAREQQFPYSSYLAKSAETLRLRIGKTFPVAFSLCNDPRGLFFGACVVLSTFIVYGIYLAVFVTDYGSVKEHRKTCSILTSAMLHADLYQPNEHPLKKLNGLSCPDNEESFLPSPAMMLKRRDDLLTADSGLLSTELSMPIFSFLDKEDEISEEEGVDQWLTPRNEQVPLSDNLSSLKRTRDALLTWARPLDEKEADMTFAEFFETLDDDEFRYDSESGNWVFDDQDVTPNEDSIETGKIMENIMKAKDETEVETEDLEKVIRDLSDIDLAELAASPEFDALLKGNISEGGKRSNADDTDDPTVTVFV